MFVNVIVLRFKLTITNHQSPSYLRNRNSVHVSLMAFGFEFLIAVSEGECFTFSKHSMLKHLMTIPQSKLMLLNTLAGFFRFV